jgi:HEAT repeat protein
MVFYIRFVGLNRDFRRTYSAEEREIQRDAAIIEHARAAAPVITALQDAGFQVNTLDELRRSGKKYGDAVPILVEWLPKVKRQDVKESIVRTLSVPWAKGVAVRVVLDEFYSAPIKDMSFRWAIGNAMEVIADQSVGDEILTIVEDSNNGMARQMFVMALGKLGMPKSIPVLIKLLRQEEVAGHAAEALGKLRAVEARQELENIAMIGKPWVRKAAKKALAKISKKQK